MGLKTETTEEKILDAAKQIFMKHGLYGARMQDIADLAGINKALLHYYFRSKEKLFDAVFDKALESYFEQVAIIGDASLPIEERLHSYVDNIFNFFEEYPQMMLFIIKEVSIAPEKFFQKVKSLKNFKPLQIAMLKEAMQKGNLPTDEPEFDPVIFIVNLHSLCAYPFIASPLFRGMLKNNGYEWDAFRKEQSKNSVKAFISSKIH
jgi:AcrR family transcriptional regulator